MRRRVDLGQETTAKEKAVLERKAKRWAAANVNKPEENPFLSAIKPDQEHYGDIDEREDELKARLDNQEFGNFMGYHNFRNLHKSDKSSESEIVESDEKSDGTCKIEGDSTKGDQLQSNPDPAFSDERLQLMEEEWFKGKNVLDIGCNRGHITYAVARLFSPRFIVGIDIDLKLINMANRDIYLHLENGVIKNSRENRLERAAELCLDGTKIDYDEDQNQFPLSSYIAHGPLALVSKDANNVNKFPNNILFVEHNYVLSRDDLVEKQKPQFDTILCLSVTKWVHLNYRDDGLKRLFKRIYRHLNPGGLLVLEAQPFKNYNKNKKLSDRLKSNFYSIKFKPDEFDDYLLSNEVGFRQIIHQNMTDHDHAGFRRPFRVFLK